MHTHLLVDLADEMQVPGAGIMRNGPNYEIQACELTAEPGFNDDDALRSVVQAALRGDRGAIVALYLDGRPVDDRRAYLTADMLEASHA